MYGVGRSKNQVIRFHKFGDLPFSLWDMGFDNTVGIKGREDFPYPLCIRTVCEKGAQQGF